MSGTDLAPYMGAVARKLYGEPNKELSDKDRLRYGAHGSLAVDLEKGAWYSHEEEKGGGVLDLIAHKTGRANGDAVAWLREELGVNLDASEPRSTPPKPISYVYHDECGAPLYRVVRRGHGAHRTFCQERHDAGRWSGGKGCMTGARLVLYRLPEILAADPAEPVFVAEGEKDCDRLRSLGLVSTTNPGGAGKWDKVDPAARAALHGRHVVLLPDLDADKKTGRFFGIEHMEKVARDLADKAASVRTLRLPIPNVTKTCKDVSDWLDQCGGTAEELRRLAAEASPSIKGDAAGEVVAEGGTLAELLRRYFVARHAGKAVIAYEDEDPEVRRRVIHFLDSDSLKLLYANQFVQVGVDSKGNPIRQPVVKAWLTSPERRTYERLALLPNQKAPPGTYNLWRGLGVAPKPGEWATIHEYLQNVICSGDEGHYGYLIGWLAYCVQYPERQAEVAVVLRGLKGAGKGTLGKMLLRIFRHHALHISNSRHLLGNFNSHLLDALFLFLDEAFWAGDKAGEGVLKALITEPSMMIEPKGLKPFLAPNRLKIVIAANADWVVPATGDERRYFAPNVSDHRRGDRAYFNRLYTAIDGDELPALLDHLLAHDLSGFEVRDPPHTRELARQKLIGADSVGRFWYDCLTEGVIVGTGNTDWPNENGIATLLLHAAYLDHAIAHGERHTKITARMIEDLQKLWASCEVKLTRPRQRDTGDRPRVYVLDNLEKHRAAFLKAMNIDEADHAWPSVEDDA